MQTRTITLGEREYTLTELPSKGNAQWRRELETAIAPLLDTFQNADKIEIDSPAQLSRLIGELRGLIFKSPETLTGLLYAYSKVLRDDREYIEVNAYDSDLLAAFTQVIQLAYPFGGLFRMVDRLNGSLKNADPST